MKHTEDWRYSKEFNLITTSKLGIIEGSKMICDNCKTPEIGELISKAPEMLEALKWFITSMSDGSLSVFTDDSEHKAVHDDNQDHINEIEALVKSLE